MAASDVLNMMKEKDVKFVDFRFTDTQGKEQHVSVPAHVVDEDMLVEGKMFDGSSIQGWKGINASDMILMPDCDTQVIDPFCEEVTMNLRCDVIEPTDMTGYNRDPRSIAKRAEAICRLQVWVTPLTLARKTSTSSLMAFNGAMKWAVFSTRLSLKKLPGIPARTTTATTWATARV
jgi:glutamine synthetase